MSNADQARDFNVNLDQVASKFGVSAERALRTIALDALERIVRRTPVGDPDYWKGHPKGNPPGNAKAPLGYIGGNARNNWWVSVNEELTNPQGRSPNKAASNEATNEGGVTISSAKLGDKVFIQNGVPYILKLEDGTQSPRQAPDGMVAITFFELEDHFLKVMAGEQAKV